MKPILVITGGSRGIGKSTIELFQQQGWQAINLSRHVCDVDGVKNFTIDLGNPSTLEDCKNSLIEIVKHAEKICLVHSAGSLAKDTITNLQADDFRTILEVNLVAPLILNQFVLSHMKPGSSIIYIGSGLSRKTVKNAASYCVTKHALIGLMGVTCQDLDNTGIHTCCICPGFTDTQMLHDYFQHDQQVLDTLKERITARRLVQPAEIASLIFYCANNPVINGAVLDANLGLLEN